VLLPLLGEDGAIVNLASEVAYSGSPGLAHDVASKAAVVGLTRVMARELGPRAMRVNALAPGFIPTRPRRTGGRHSVRPGRDAAGRVGEPADLLGALTFLLSDESAFVTGQCLLVNGGRLLG
jgi:3-oxoacyl-[acyl-carrier protein] reductase